MTQQLQWTLIDRFQLEKLGWVFRIIRTGCGSIIPENGESYKPNCCW